jgi:hypothetical protein
MSGSGSDHPQLFDPAPLPSVRVPLAAVAASTEDLCVGFDRLASLVEGDDVVGRERVVWCWFGAAVLAVAYAFGESC